MLKVKFTRKKIIFIASFLIFIFIVNGIISSVIEKKITDILLKNESEYYTAHIESSHFKLLRRTLVLNNISLFPNQIAIDSLKQKNSKKQNLEEITLSSIKFNGVGLMKLLFSKKIEISTLEINDLTIINFINAERTKAAKNRKPINIDSIYIKKLKGFQIDKIALNNFVYEVVDVKTNEIEFKNEPLSFVSSGFKLEEVDSNLFKLSPVKESFEISNIELSINALKYNFAVDKIAFNFKDKFVGITNLTLKPQVPKEELAMSFQFNKDVIDMTIKELDVYNFNLTKFINKKSVLMDSILVSGLNIELYKDKRRPFNKSIYKQLPNVKLKNTKTDFHIAKIKINKSALLIEERLEKRDTLLEIALDNINATILNITSIKEFRKNPMLVNVDAVLMKKAPFNLNINFPLDSHNESFSFNGNLEAADLRLFDSALYPAIGLKVLNGRLNSMKFSATANDNFSSGTMTMLYQNLEANVFKAHSLEKNKFLSWSVNAIIKKSNPHKNKKARIAVMEFERDKYKGIGNYIWKTILSGITNSIAPGGKLVKTHKKRKK